MNSKTFVGGLVAGITAFLLGWVIYGMLLMDYFSSNMVQYEGLMKDPPELWAIAVAHLSWGLLLAYVFNASSVNSIGKGMVCGALVFFLITLGTDFMFYAQMNLFNLQLLCIDVLISLVMGGLVGAVLGWWFGRGQTASV